MPHWLQGVARLISCRNGRHIRKDTVRYWLSNDLLRLKKSHDYTGSFDTGILEAVDSFVELSQGNTSVLQVMLYPNDEDAGNYELWDKVGQGVGNLTSLEDLNIILSDHNERHTPAPDWEILARIL
jgi:hypothetical protein